MSTSKKQFGILKIKLKSRWKERRGKEEMALASESLLMISISSVHLRESFGLENKNQDWNYDSIDHEYEICRGNTLFEIMNFTLRSPCM